MTAEAAKEFGLDRPGDREAPGAGGAETGRRDDAGADDSARSRLLSICRVAIDPAPCACLHGIRSWSIWRDPVVGVGYRFLGRRA